MATTTRTRKALTTVSDSPVKPVRTQPSRKELATADRHKWAHVGVYMCVIMSSGLNGYANALHSPVVLAGWALGIMIPCLIFVLARVAGMQWRAKRIGLARLTAGAGLGLLTLSVWHCATSLALLTGSHILLALPMAVAIDCGLVACELDIVLG